ncbi:MAG: guanylate kinase [Lachnospiraceae bacterium]|nr:guanylate kinase [Lachnospiraceae bacterium]
MGKIFYLMGKSATGKDTMFQHLVESPEFDLRTVVLYTTRPIREGEVEGVEYHFIDEEEMERYMATGKVIEKRTYHTVCGDWSYMTIDDGQFDLEKYNYLAIGTLESYAKIREYFGPEAMVPIYIWVEDGDRLARALKRERKQAHPRIAEVCRRYLADEADFSEENLQAAGIDLRFENDDREATMAAIEEYIREQIQMG